MEGKDHVSYKKPHVHDLINIWIVLKWSRDLNFCDDNLSTSVLPDSVGYLCSKISPAATKPTTLLGHGQLHLVNCLWSCKTTPTQKHRPSGWTTHFNAVYQICKLCMLTQSTHLGCSCAMALAFTQIHKLVQFTPTYKPHKCNNDGASLRPFKPYSEKGTPLLCTPEIPWIF